MYFYNIIMSAFIVKLCVYEQVEWVDSTCLYGVFVSFFCVLVGSGVYLTAM